MKPEPLEHPDFKVALAFARNAKTVDDLRIVLRDIAIRAGSANSAAAVDSIRQIAAAAAQSAEQQS